MLVVACQVRRHCLRYIGYLARSSTIDLTDDHQLIHVRLTSLNNDDTASNILYTTLNGKR